VAVTRRAFVRGGVAAGAVLLGGPRLAGAAVGGMDPTDHFGTSRVSRLFPGTFLAHADLHNHSLLSDGSGDEDDAFASMRAHGLDIAALTDHSTLNWGAPSPCFEAECRAVACIDEAAWQKMGVLAQSADEPEAFVALRGFEWSSPSLGHVNVWFTETWIDPLHTGGLGTGENAEEFLHDEIPEIGPIAADALVGPQALIDGVARETGAGMALFYDWLHSPPDRAVVGGGNDGLAGFNHPGREVGRFSRFSFDDRIADRLVSLEVFNRGEDYLFESTETGELSPVVEALDAGWRVGLIGVSDNHGTNWGQDAGRGRAGLWVTSLSRNGVRDAMLARRAFATVVAGLRLDAAANGVRMGGVVPAHNPLRIVLDIDGPGLRGKPLSVQLLRPGSGPLPDIAHVVTATVPGPDSPLIALDVDVGADPPPWLVVRVSDPSLEPDERAPEGFASFGAAVAYASPFFLVPAAAQGQRPSAPAATPTGTAGATAGTAGGTLPATGGSPPTAAATAAAAAALAARWMSVRRPSPGGHPH